jgi:2-methylcitrate dehydratase
MKDFEARPRVPVIGRRDLMKLGAGLVMPALPLRRGAAQSPATRPPVRTVAGRRASGNGPIDNTTRQLVTYVSSFSESNLTDRLVDALNNTMVDTIASLISGFDCEPARIGVRLARTTQSDLKSTVLGYGVTTTPEIAGFTGTCMVRHTDFNDHTSDMTPGILAVAEAVGATGPQVLVAIALGYQVNQALGAARAGGTFPRLSGWDQGINVGTGTVMAVGKLLGLNDDQLANALSLSLVPHIPMRVTRSGALSMWKGCATAEAVRTAIFAALMAREGMTGPSQPFEGRDGLWDQVTGPFKELRLPAREPGVTFGGTKRTPTEGYTQNLLPVIPEIRAWTKVEDIASIDIELTHSGFMEIADPPKFDPMNRETADHSAAYTIAVALTDGDVWYTSFSEDRIMDPALRQLMQKTTVRPNADFPDRERSRITVRTKDGRQLVKDAFQAKPMTREDIRAKFDRVCADVVTNPVRDRAHAAWSNLRAAKDLTEPIASLTAFQPGRGRV